MTPPLTNAEVEEIRAFLATNHSAEPWAVNHRQDVGRLLATLDERTRERDEMAATLANERGEGEPPSPGWTYSHSQGRWSHPDGRWAWRNAWLRLADGTDCIRWGWERLGPSAEGREVTARAAMKAADAALAADGGGRG